VDDHAHLFVRRVPTAGDTGDAHIWVESISTVSTVGDTVVDQQVSHDVLARRCAAVLNVLRDEAEPTAVAADATCWRAAIASIVSQSAAWSMIADMVGGACGHPG
jgi:hypothetical protein